MVLVAPGICRYTVNGLFAGRPIANILDMRVDTTGSPIDRGAALNEIAGDIINNWSDHILPLVVDDYSAVTCTWVDLDEEDGPTGSRSSTSADVWPQAGTNATAPMPANVAMLVRKNIVGSRGRRNGRMYLVGAAEAYSDAAAPNSLTGALVTAINAGLSSFLDGINDPATSPTEPERELVVVHTVAPRLPSGAIDPDGEPIYNGFSRVASLDVDSRFATQRDRLR